MVAPVSLEPKKGITQNDVAKWLKAGKIQDFYLQTATKVGRSIEESLRDSPLAENIKYKPNGNSCEPILFFPGGTYQADYYFGGLKTGHDDYQQSWALMAPLLEEKKPTIFGKIWRAVKEPAKQKYAINFDKSDIEINLLSTVGDHDRRSTSYKLRIKCDTDIGNLIFTEACGSEKEAFNFFVKIIPGFEQVEGADFEKYCKDGKYLFSAKTAEFSSEKFKTREHFNALRHYFGKKIKIS